MVTGGSGGGGAGTGSKCKRGGGEKTGERREEREGWRDIQVGERGGRKGKSERDVGVGNTGGKGRWGGGWGVTPYPVSLGTFVRRW